MQRFIFLLIGLLPVLTEAQVSFTQSNLPIIVINTDGQDIPDEPKIDAGMGIIWHGDGQINYLSDAPNHFNGKIGIERRGSTSQLLSEKKPYSVELRNDAGADTSLSLLGMPKESDWVLLAPYSDKSLMRDVLIYKLAGSFMAWAPRTHYCELVLNGHYEGIYALVEKIKRNKNRVDIDKLTPDENIGDDLTGGYIMKIDKTEGGFNDGFLSAFTPPNGTSQQIYFQYHYPKPEDISPDQKYYIKGVVDHFEKVLQSPTFRDTTTGYPALIDVQSFIDFMLVNELAKNVDGYRLSTFFYKDKDSQGGKLKMGPVWDFNIALGNADYCGGALTKGWATSFNDICRDDQWLIPFWWQKLKQDPVFLFQARNRWRELRGAQLSTNRILGCIDSLAAVVNEAQVRNFQRFPILGQYIWPNAFVGNTYGEEVKYLKGWIQDRLIWLDDAFETYADGVYSYYDYFDPKIYPNPSHGSPVTFSYYVRKTETVEVRIYNSTGQLMARLYDNHHINGESSLKWTPPPATGLYFYGIFINGARKASGEIIING